MATFLGKAADSVNLVILIISHFGFKDKILVLIAPVPSIKLRYILFAFFCGKLNFVLYYCAQFLK